MVSMVPSSARVVVLDTVVASLPIFEADLGLPKIDPVNDRIMICGSPGLNKDIKHILEARGFVEGSTTSPGDYVVERAFVEQ